MRRSTVMRSRATDRRSASKCQGDGQIRPSTKRWGYPRVPVGVRTSRLSSRETGKALIFTPVRESSGECRLNHQITIETGTEYSKGWGQWFQVFRIKHLGQTIIDSTGTRVEERVERGWA